MKGSRFSEEQIIGILRAHEAGAATARRCAASMGFTADTRGMVDEPETFPTAVPGGEAAGTPSAWWPQESTGRTGTAGTPVWP